MDIKIISHSAAVMLHKPPRWVCWQWQRVWDVWALSLNAQLILATTSITSATDTLTINTNTIFIAIINSLLLLLLLLLLIYY